MKAKSPLQQWAWDRFQLKGSIAGMMSRMSQLQGLVNLTYFEAERIEHARRVLSIISKDWDESHKATRGRWE